MSSHVLAKSATQTATDDGERERAKGRQGEKGRKMINEPHKANFKGN